MKLTYCLILLLPAPQLQGQTNKGYLPDEIAAVKRAQVIVSERYGKKQIESERPLTATLKNGVWTVDGSLHCSDGEGGESQYASAASLKFTFARQMGASCL